MMQSCLVIEDDFGFYLEAESVLKQLGFSRIDNAVSIQDIEKFMADHSYDLIISNIFLQNGEIAPDYFNRHPTKIPIILMSVLNDDATYEKIQKGKKHLFLVKPVNLLTLKSSIEYLSETQPAETIKNSELKQSQSIRLKDGSAIISLRISDICFIKSDGNYCSFYSSERKVTTRERLSYFREKLSAYRFIQVHKSYVVNLALVTAANFSQNQLEICRQKIPIGRKYKDLLKKNYQPL